MRLWISIITFIILALCPVVTLITISKFGTDFFHYGLVDGKFDLTTKGYWMIVIYILASALYFTPFAIMKIKKQRKVDLEE